jgi:arginase family enzyme
MNFTGVYDYEPFSRNRKFTWIDCTHLQGVECYCDKEGALALKKAIENYPAEGIHFIDSGNYHYLTKFWTDKIQQPFSLIVFDHHPDMQPPLFEEMISCGSWVEDVIKTNPFLKKVIIMGASEQLIKSVAPQYQNQVEFYSEQSLEQDTTWKKFSAEVISTPVYISVDKDVLNPQSAATNWNQGSFTLKELEQLLSIILKHEQTIGIDICGECPTTLNIFEEEKEAQLDSAANKELLKLFLSFQSHTFQ